MSHSTKEFCTTSNAVKVIREASADDLTMIRACEFVLRRSHDLLDREMATQLLKALNRQNSGPKQADHVLFEAPEKEA